MNWTLCPKGNVIATVNCTSFILYHIFLDIISNTYYYHDVYYYYYDV